MHGASWQLLSAPKALLPLSVLALRCFVTPTDIPAEVSPANAEHTNRLGREKSPYLLQHAHNPVDWYPWGEEAFAKARRENKPIFLSVGYTRRATGVT